MTSDDDKIRLLVDQEIQVKGAVSGKSMLMGEKVIEVATDVVHAQLASTLSKVMTLIAQTPSQIGDVSVEEIRFSLVFTGAGEVSLASLAKANLEGKTGLEFKLVRNRQP